MKNIILKSGLAIGILSAAAFSGVPAASAQNNISKQTAYEYIAPPSNLQEIGEEYRGVGPAISGSVDFSALPSKAKKFLRKNCDGHAVVICEKEFTSGDYTVKLADGIDFLFDSKGNLVNISAPEHYSFSPKLLRAIVPEKLYNLLEHNGFNGCVEAVHHDRTGYRLEVADPVFEQVCYDSSGVLTLIADPQ